MNENDDALRGAAVVMMDDNGLIGHLIKVGRLGELILRYGFHAIATFASTDV